MSSKRSPVVLAMAFLALALMAFQVTPVAAVWYGSFYPTYEYGGSGNTDVLFTQSYSTSAGTCKVKGAQGSGSSGYEAGDNAWAWIGSDTTMTETITAIWYISATWSLDYRIAVFGSGLRIEIAVIYQVYNALNEKLQEKVAWSDILLGNNQAWDDSYATINQVIEKTFTVDLQDDYAYMFRVMLKVTTVYQGLYYQCTANSNHANPACLTVNHIDFYDNSQ